MRDLRTKTFVMVLVILSFCAGWLLGRISNQDIEVSSVSVEPLSVSNMTHDDQARFVTCSYSLLDKYFDKNRTVADVDDCDSTADYDFEKLFITLMRNGRVRGCQSGSTDTDAKRRIPLDIYEATYECIEDKRFGGVLREDETSDVEIVFTFLFNRQRLKNNNLDHLENNIELGVHAIELQNGEKKACFKESVPISRNYDLKKTLERLCGKASLDEGCYKDDNTLIYRYDTLSFKGDRKKNIVPLYRYDVPVTMEEITKQRLFEGLSMAQDWFLRNIASDSHLLEYRYYPSKDKYSSKNNHARQLASLWAMTALRSFLNTTDLSALIDMTLDHYLAFKNTADDYAYITPDGESKLSYNAFLILSLLNHPEYPGRDAFLTELAKGILTLQNDDGSYDTYFMSDKKTGVDYYPGEAMLALMKLYEATGNSSFLASVEKAFPYYRSYWRNNKNTAFVPWHTQAYRLLYQATRNPDVADFVFEMNDWVIRKYQIQRSDHPDEIGGFPKTTPRCSTSSYMEGITDAYMVAMEIDDMLHVSQYAQSIRIGTRFILQTQYTDQNTFYLKNPSRALGGFRKSLVDNTQRNDYTQHAVMALLKVCQTNLF